MNFLDIVNPEALKQIQSLSDVYKSAQPFPHTTIENFLRPEIAETLHDAFPMHTESFWHVYNNPLERKLACNVREHLPNSIQEVLEALNSDECRAFFSELTGIDKLRADPSLHGGGMHCIRRGGKLDVHVDYSIHPALKLERRLNLIVYLNKNWDDAWGGNLELWNAEMSHCEKKISPQFNRAVIFDTGDQSYHGHPEPLNCPEDIARRSLAVYYLTEPRPNATERYRALFVARPGDPEDAETENFRALRAGLETGAQLHRTETSKK